MNLDRVNERYYGETGSKNDQEIVNRRVHWMVSSCKPGTVLDAGCSQGITALLLAREGFRVTGLDIEKQSIEFANLELQKESQSVIERLSFHVFDLSQSIADFFGTFDNIILGEVLEHLAHPEHVVKNLWNALNSDGQLILTVPFGEHKFYDHKRTIFVSSLIELTDKFFILSSLKIEDGYLRAKFFRRGEQGTSLLTNNEEHLWHLLEQTERAYLALQRLSTSRIEAFKERNKLLESSLKIFEQVSSSTMKEKLPFTTQEVSRSKEQQIHSERLLQVRDKLDKFLALERASERSIQSLKRDLAQLKRERADLRAQVNSISYRLGTLITGFIKHPLKNILHVPPQFTRLLWEFREKSKQGRASSSPATKGICESNQGGASHLQTPSVLFLPINGAGLGHLTRCLAIAKELRKLSPATEITFFTTSIALPAIRREGFQAYHIPPLKSAPIIDDVKYWNKLFSQQLEEVIHQHNISTIIFDGTFPYACIRRTISAFPQIKKIWCSRRLYKVEEQERSLKKFESSFDATIIPGEIALRDGNFLSNSNSDDSSTVHIPPIIYGSHHNLLSREEVRKYFDVPDDKKLVYVQLGAGNINDTTTIEEHVIGLLNTIPNCEVVLAESLISLSQIVPRGRYKIIRDFPNSRYFRGFDLAILAAGYNSVHEAVYFNLPSIFIPNPHTTSDNQKARAQAAAQFGDFSAIDECSLDKLPGAINTFLGSTSSSREITPIFENGAVIFAAMIHRHHKATSKKSGAANILPACDTPMAIGA